MKLVGGIRHQGTILIGSSNLILLLFSAGDHVALYPVNDVFLVNRFGELLSVDLDVVVSLINFDG